MTDRRERTPALGSIIVNATATSSVISATILYVRTMSEPTTWHDMTGLCFGALASMLMLAQVVFDTIHREHDRRWAALGEQETMHRVSGWDETPRSPTLAAPDEYDPEREVR